MEWTTYIDHARPIKGVDHFITQLILAAVDKDLKTLIRGFDMQKFIKTADDHELQMLSVLMDEKEEKIRNS